MKISQPNRVSRTYKQRLLAPLEEVFPLLCPVREKDWIYGWDPEVVLSHSGLAEPDCIFVTGSDSDEAIWYITRHEKNAGFVEMIKITPTVTACRLTIQLEQSENGSTADITYTHTSLGPNGDTFIKRFTEPYFQKFMQDWESRVNYYLESGNLLRE